MGQLGDGSRDDGELGALQGVLALLRFLLDRALLYGALKSARVRIKPDHLRAGPFRSQPDGGPDQPRADECDSHPISLPIRAATAATSAANSANWLVGICCAASDSASSGRGCVSTMIPSAPTAAAARASGSTRSRRPAACEGS